MLQLKNLSFLFLLLALVSCKQNSQSSDRKLNSAISENEFAKGFKIEDYKSFKILNVFNPWQHAEGVVFKYILTSDIKNVPDSLKKYDVILTPVKKIICLSTTHIAFLKELGREDAICGVSAPEFIYDADIRSKVDRGEIKNVGYDQAINIETVISLKPDFIMAYGVGSEASGQFQRLKQLGIKVIFNAEYLEKTPVGKAEWIKFVASFFDQEDSATSVFNKTKDRYQSLVKLGTVSTEKPMILSGLPWKGVWYVPGGKSYAANFIYDAGGDYLWKEDLGTESLALSLETIMERSNKADIWINPGSVNSLGEISSMDPRMNNVKCYKEKQVFNFNLRTTPGGGNDFWESGAVHPDWVLKDLIAIFHPELIPNHTFVYYQKLK